MASSGGSEAPKRKRASVADLLILASDEHERELAEIRSQYEQQLDVMRRELDEARDTIAKAAAGPIDSAPSGKEHEVTHAPDDISLSPKSRSKASTFMKMVPTLSDATAMDSTKKNGFSFEYYIDIIATVVVACHIGFLIIQMQYDGRVIAEDAGLIDFSVKSDSYGLTLTVMEHAFNMFFVLEIALRISLFKMMFFKSPNGRIQWINLLELSLVIATSVDLYLPLAADFNFKTLRPVVHFIRLLRMLRLLRLVRFFLKLRILVTTVAASFVALFWSIILLVFTMLIAALFLNQSLLDTMAAQEIEEERRRWIYNMYGTSTRAFYTVFELTFSGGWPNYARPLVEDVSALWAVFFFVYIIAVVFAMFRIITALFLRDTLALAANDAETAIQEKLEQKAAIAKKLQHFFNAADASGDGMLSLDEFEAMLEIPKVSTWLSLLEVDVKSATQIFELLEDDDNCVSVDDFVQGMMRIKGQAKAQELYKLLILQSHMSMDLSSIGKRIDKMERSLREAGRRESFSI